MSDYTIRQAMTSLVLAKANGTTARLFYWLDNAQRLAEHHKRNWITPRIDTIATELARSRRTIQRALRELEARGAITVQNRFRSTGAGIMRQISHRIHVTRAPLAAAITAGRIAFRRLLLRKYSSDNPVTPRTARSMEAPSADLFLDRNAWENRHAHPRK